MPGVHAIVVAWEAEPAAVRERLAALAGCVAAIVVVDNSAAVDPARWSVLAEVAPCIPIMNGANLGVAAGFNAGVAAALERGADHVLLLDDDSVPERDMVPALLAAWQRLAAAGGRVAAVGPDFIDSTSSRRAVFVTVDGWRLRRVSCPAAGDGTLRSDYLVSSGMLVHRDAWLDIGTMDESLYIDYVDTDWCLRARARGYACFGICAARMRHRFGEGTAVRLPGGRTLPARAPVRSYYQGRNLLLMLRRRHCPLRWKWNALVRVLGWLVINTVTARGRHLAMLIEGLAHGAMGRTGPRPA